MQLFSCQCCDQVLYFENTLCIKCNHQVGYLPELGKLSAVEPDGPDWKAFADPARRYRFCANWEKYACNWMVDAEEGERFCQACRHNRTIPDLSDPENHHDWIKIETAKRRLIYTLIKLDLPLPTVASGDPEPLVFDFLSDLPGKPKVLTGHDNGIITISLREANDATREEMRRSMGELYRTLLGHFRHESGHFYWDKLVRDGGHIESFRALFGDDSEDYDAALARHYAEGPPPNWQDQFVSAYATMHPWEDWAETWANYLHIVDTLEMASSFNISLNPDVSDDETLKADIALNPHETKDFARLIDAWLPLTYAVNCLNRSMGHPDLYPFIIPSRVGEKLTYIHDLIHGQLAQTTPEPQDSLSPGAEAQNELATADQ